jgi:hypothetical protein
MEDRELFDVLASVSCPPEIKGDQRILYLLSIDRIDKDRARRLLKLTELELLQVYHRFLLNRRLAAEARCAEAEAAAFFGRP